MPSKLGDGKPPTERFKQERKRIVRELKRNCLSASQEQENLARSRADLVFAAGQMHEIEADGLENSEEFERSKQSKSKLDEQMDRITAEIDRLAVDAQKLLHEYDRLLHGAKFGRKTAETSKAKKRTR